MDWLQPGRRCSAGAVSAAAPVQVGRLLNVRRLPSPSSQVSANMENPNNPPFPETQEKYNHAAIQVGGRGGLKQHLVLLGQSLAGRGRRGKRRRPAHCLSLPPAHAALPFSRRSPLWRAACTRAWGCCAWVSAAGLPCGLCLYACCSILAPSIGIQPSCNALLLHPIFAFPNRRLGDQLPEPRPGLRLHDGRRHPDRPVPGQVSRQRERLPLPASPPGPRRPHAAARHAGADVRCSTASPPVCHPPSNRYILGLKIERADRIQEYLELIFDNLWQFK